VKRRSRFAKSKKTKRMKAVFCNKYGGPEVLEVKKIPKMIPGQGELLIRNYASSITTADTFLRRGEPKFGRLFLGWNKPRQPMVGTGFAGVVEQIGNEVTQFKVGDRVYGETVFGFGANAEFVCVNEMKSIIQILPPFLSFEEAAPMCDGVLTSYNFLIDIGKLEKGKHVLINGASGALGVAAVQIAKYIGAHVTAVCSGHNVKMVKELGADIVIDYHKKDFTSDVGLYDMIYDTVGKSSFSKSKKSLKIKGQYLSPVLSLPLLLTMIRTAVLGSKKAKFDATGLKSPQILISFLKQLESWTEQGKLKTIIDREYRIEDISEAHTYVDSGRKKGNIVLKFDCDSI
jgi:NADPH:quinone reductase-like Zn-dependent oxidoreductase